MTVASRESELIAYLRFPLVAAIVFIHGYMPGIYAGMEYVPAAELPLYNYSSLAISQILARIAVPLMFFFSGYLFFSGDAWNFGIYKAKLSKRIHTLLVPYLFWNSFVLLLFFALQNIPSFAGLFSGGNKPVADYGPVDFINAFWSGAKGFPACYQMWYVRDLMVMAVCSPLIRLLVRYAGPYGVAFFGIIWFTGLPKPVPGLSPVTLFFFTAGAFFRIGNLSFVDTFRKQLRLSMIIYPAAALADLSTKGEVFNLYIHNAGIIAGIVFAVNVVSRFAVDRGSRIGPLLTSSAFFLYAFHEPLLTFLRKSAQILLQPQSDTNVTLLYLTVPVAAILCSLGLFRLFRRLLPSFTGLITGRRG